MGSIIFLSVRRSVTCLVRRGRSLFSGAHCVSIVWHLHIRGSNIVSHRVAGGAGGAIIHFCLSIGNTICISLSSLLRKVAQSTGTVTELGRVKSNLMYSDTNIVANFSRENMKRNNVLLATAQFLVYNKNGC